MKKRILVTGGSGFIGRNVIPLLRDRGYEITALGLGNPPTDLRQGVHWQGCDLLRRGMAASAIRKVQPDLLLHLAWEARPGIYKTATSNLEWVSASLELFKAFYESGGTRGVAAGTCAEYQLGTASPLVENKSPTIPATLYGAAKLSFATLVHALALQLRVQFAWGRIFYVFGRFEPAGRLIPSLISALQRGTTIETSSGKTVRDYIGAEDVARAFVSILESNVTGPVNIGSGKGVATAALLATVADRTGNAHLWRRGARPDDSGEPADITADISRLLNETSYVPSSSLADAVAAAVEWWKGTHE